MVADGRIRLPLALDAKAHQGFELTVDGGRSPRPPPGARSPHPRQLTCPLIWPSRLLVVPLRHMGKIALLRLN